MPKKQYTIKKGEKLKNKLENEKTCIKDSILVKSANERFLKKKYEKKKRKEWKKRLQSSPFNTDLVADAERIEEENKIRKYIEQKNKKREKKTVGGKQ